jgi:signal transduction histidine kinase/DNA-binding NarL/FixJ family response regulator/HPt (histidine-containing phosphotransfer) domain-containing protein
MITEHKQKLSKYLIPVFYVTAMVALIFYAWYEQDIVIRGGSGPLYRNLRECPAYARKGFDPSDLRKIPDESGEWKRFQTSTRRIVNSSLDIPKRGYLSPWGMEAEEFTIITLLEMDSAAMAFLDGNISVVPGIFFAGIGENWEVYFNGKLIISQMHPDETGRIKERRTWRNVYFPLDSSLVVPGTNILALRILGDPTYRGTGLFYSAAPMYMDDYRVIEGRRLDFLLIALCGIFAFIGIYYLVLFFSVKKKTEIFNLYFGIFSILLCIYNFTIQGMVDLLIPNSDISIRLEYGSYMMAIPALGIFIEALGRGKITKISWGYLAFCSLLCLTQTFFCAQYGEEVITIWNVVTMIYVSYVIAYDVIYFHFWGRHKRKGPENDAPGLPIGSILVGMVLSYLCGLFDILDVLFLNISIDLFPYSIFAVHIGMAFTLSQRFSGMYKRLEQSNTMLEIAVQERTMELKKQTEIAINASNTKSKFLATMSHEIRTPLNAVIGLSEIELRRNLPESSRDNIVQIYQSGSSLLGIINDILDISKIEAGGFELVPVEYETASLLSDTVMQNRVRIGSKPIAFVLEIGGDFPRMLLGDELRIKQILNNLLSNAIKYTAKGTVTLSAAWENFSGGENEALLRFTVRDTGRGIRSEDIGKLFSDYTQLDTRANRKIEGTGLGLEITKKLVDMMGGNITVESEYGRGSAFTVEIIQGIPDYLPIGEETAEKLRNFNYTADRKGDDIDRSWMPYGKVLVVDDLPVNLQIARGLLEPYGLLVESAESGQKAIELVKAENPRYDLIFMDHMMPEMDGIEAVRIIRQESGSEYCRNVPIIALTANALMGNTEMFLSKGFNGFISKPIDTVQLNDALNQWIRDKGGAENREWRAGNGERRSNYNAASDLHSDNLNRNSPIPTPNSQFPNIPGVNVKKGIAMTGGTTAAYTRVLSVFSKNAEERLPLFQTPPDSDTLHMFITQVHSLKSSTASIGAAEVSSGAAELEAAGKAGDLAFIRDNLPNFAKQLAELVLYVKKALETKKPEKQNPLESSFLIPYSSLFHKLAEALKSQNAFEIDRILKELNQKPLDAKTRETLEKISDDVLITEFDSALKKIDEVLRI